MSKESVEERQYEMVDTKALAEALGESALQQELRNIPESDIYEGELVEDNGMKVRREYRSRWANLLFSLITQYQELIEQYHKK